MLIAHLDVEYRLRCRNGFHVTQECQVKCSHCHFCHRFFQKITAFNIAGFFSNKGRVDPSAVEESKISTASQAELASWLKLEKKANREFGTDENPRAQRITGLRIAITPRKCLAI